MLKILALGLLIYVIWKIAEGFFTPNKAPKSPKDKNKDDDGFTPFEEV